MPWTPESKEHIAHLSDLKRMLASAAGREYGPGNEPDGFRELWDPFFQELYIVACLMYLEKVFGKDKHWLVSENIGNYPMLERKLESLRCVRNCIVHNGGTLAEWTSATQIEIIRNYDTDVRAGNITEEIVRIGEKSSPYFSIQEDGRIVSHNESVVRSISIQYLMIEGKVEVVEEPA